MGSWTVTDVPSLDGKTAVITGANSGIGFEAATMLAARGARVILACRDRSRGKEAVERLLARVPRADAELAPLDLASLASVRTFTDGLCARFDGLDLLVNNAGIMAIPRRETADGFEMQIGTNHLGHFALTARLWPLLRARADARVVNVSSMAHRAGRVAFDDLHGRRSYQRWLAYGQSKLANLLFTFELDRRVRTAKIGVSAVACHPGYSATNLQATSAQDSPFADWFMGLGNRLVAQPAEAGAWPTVYAAAMPDVASGDYIGPGGWFEMGGLPRKVESNAAALDPDAARRLWELSERETGEAFTVA
jgi:NAD(P)-dependent dehydrogenase (short-subunit alcohol dehydrogenase family)